MADHPFWRDESGLHIATRRSKKTMTGVTGYISVASFDPTGASLGEQTFEVFPADLDSLYTGLTEVAGAGDPASTFAAIVAHRYPSDANPTERILLASATASAFQLINLPWKTGEVELDHIGWDGEQFAIHGRWLATNKLLLLRMSLKGVFSGKPSFIGPRGPTTIHSFEIRTDPLTGYTWNANEYAEGVGLNGHDRQGNPFPHPSETDLYGVTGAGVCSPGSGFLVSVGIASDGALVAWPHEFDGLCLQRVGLDLQPKAAAFKWPATVFQLPPMVTLAAGETTIERISDKWWVGAREARAVWSLWTSDTEIASKEKLVTFSPADCYETKTCPSLQLPSMPATNLSSFLWKDELWLGFVDESIAGGQNSMMPYRVVRVAPGCTYPSMWDIVHP